MRIEQLRPIAGRVIIRRDDADEVSKGGIVIPEQAKETPLFGTIVAIARDFDPDNPLDVGDRVLHPKYIGDEVECDDGVALFVDVDDVIAILE